jgi:hypothetical protein
MKRFLVAATLPLISLAACAGGYGYGGGAYVGAPYAYGGFYDDYYGPIYDGYWGDDGGFYYRRFDHDRHFHRGDPNHFSRSAPAGGNFHSMQGTLQPDRRMHMPHFDKRSRRENPG